MFDMRFFEGAMRFFEGSAAVRGSRRRPGFVIVTGTREPTQSARREVDDYRSDRDSTQRMREKENP
jgi:hypothetical protein